MHKTYDLQEENPPTFRLEFANKWDPRNDEFRREHEYDNDDPRETYLRATLSDESVVEVEITKEDPGDGMLNFCIARGISGTLLTISRCRCDHCPTYWIDDSIVLTIWAGMEVPYAKDELRI